MSAALATDRAQGSTADAQAQAGAGLLDALGWLERRVEGETQAGAGDPLADLRRAARARLERDGLPGPRDEAWRGLDLRPVVRPAWADPTGGAEVPLAALAAACSSALDAPAAHEGGAGDLLATLRGPRVVLGPGRGQIVNLSAAPGGRLEPGLTVHGLASDWPAAVAAGLGALAPVDAAGAGWTPAAPGPAGANASARADADLGPFAALNTLGLLGGVWIDVAAGADVTLPLALVRASAAGGFTPTAAPGRPTLHLPRVLVTLGRGARLLLVEVAATAGAPDAAGANGADPTLALGVTEVALADGARLEHVRIGAERQDALRLDTVAVRVGRDARYALRTFHLGGRLVREDLRVRLDAPGAEADLAGLALVGTGRTVDTRVWLDHAHPHGTSRQRWKHVLAGDGRATFDGQVHVHPQAQKTAAEQRTHNLLLSRGAHAQTTPRLRIHADDVKCSHGATMGRLAPDALFYLRARGIPAAQARAMLTSAFAAEVTDAVGLEGLRAALRARVEGHAVLGEADPTPARAPGRTGAGA